MNDAINDSKRFRRNTTWKAQPHSAHCARQFEVIAEDVGAVFKRCFKCGRLEAE